MTQGQQAKDAVTLKRNGLTVECFFDNSGKLARKIERYERQFTEYAYLYDAKGHLTTVRRDGVVTESYQYNQSGQRVEHKRDYRGFSDSTRGMLLYDEAGRLIRAGDTTFYYDKRGALTERSDNQGVTKYFYGKDTMLDRVILPSKKEIRYAYGASNPIGPARRFRNDTVTAEFVWFDPLRLAAYKDHETLLEYTFSYNDFGILDKVRIDAFRPKSQKPKPGTDWAASSSGWLETFAAQERQHRLHDFLGKRSMPFEFLCGCDQVGTLKILTDKNGRLVKEIVRDSFGVQHRDSFPDLFMPIGFAGGLVDPDTGLVRFGYRDYDPSVGRFTAPDPLGDTGGDHDLYDYCIDDPVTMNDPSGLSPGLLLPIPWAAKQFVKGIGKRIAKSFFADTLNAPEEMVDVRNRVRKIEEKIDDGTATKDELQRLGKDRQREDELWKDYGKHYIKHERDFYRRYFPDDDYADRKFREQQSK